MVSHDVQTRRPEDSGREAKGEEEGRATYALSSGEAREEGDPCGRRSERTRGCSGEHLLGKRIREDGCVMGRRDEGRSEQGQGTVGVGLRSHPVEMANKIPTVSPLKEVASALAC